MMLTDALAQARTAPKANTQIAPTRAVPAPPRTVPDTIAGAVWGVPSDDARFVVRTVPAHADEATGVWAATADDRAYRRSDDGDTTGHTSRREV
jgi:hypothetical protein